MSSIGHGIINADGELWKLQRKAGVKFFSPANLKALVDVVLPHHYAETRAYLHEAARENRVIDLQHVFLDFTTRLVGKLAYDVCLTTPFALRRRKVQRLIGLPE